LPVRNFCFKNCQYVTFHTVSVCTQAVCQCCVVLRIGSLGERDKTNSRKEGKDKEELHLLVETLFIGTLDLPHQVVQAFGQGRVGDRQVLDLVIGNSPYHGHL